MIAKQEFFLPPTCKAGWLSEALSQGTPRPR